MTLKDDEVKNHGVAGMVSTKSEYDEIEGRNFDGQVIRYGEKDKVRVSVINTLYDSVDRLKEY